MADEADLASASADFHLARAVSAARIAAGSRSCAEAAIECEDCGDEIPEERRQAVPGCTRCVFCQTKAERG